MEKNHNNQRYKTRWPSPPLFELAREIISRSSSPCCWFPLSIPRTSQQQRRRQREQGGDEGWERGAASRWRFSNRNKKDTKASISEIVDHIGKGGLGTLQLCSTKRHGDIAETGSELSAFALRFQVISQRNFRCLSFLVRNPKSNEWCDDKP